MCLEFFEILFTLKYGTYNTRKEKKRKLNTFKDIDDFIKKNGLSKFKASFSENNIDLYDLLLIEERDLEDMNFTKKEKEINKIISTIIDFQEFHDISESNVEKEKDRNEMDENESRDENLVEDPHFNEEKEATKERATNEFNSLLEDLNNRAFSMFNFRRIPKK